MKLEKGGGLPHPPPGPFLLQERLRSNPLLPSTPRSLYSKTSFLQEFSGEWTEDGKQFNVVDNRATNFLSTNQWPTLLTATSE